MNEKNIETVKEQLMSLGLPPGIEFDLRANICLQQDQFHLSHRQVKEQDIINSVFYFEKKEGEYCCSYYEAYLRKKILLSDLVVNEIDVKELDERMSKIDWQILLLNNSSGNLQSENKSTWKREEEIENIVVDLKKLSITPDGLQLADRLKIKFWMDTPFVFLIPNIGTLKNQYEISQRFYFFQDEEQISLDEAYRFLSHRWREKLLNAKKKHTENDDSNNNALSLNENKQEKKQRNIKGKKRVNK